MQRPKTHTIPLVLFSESIDRSITPTAISCNFALAVVYTVATTTSSKAEVWKVVCFPLRFLICQVDSSAVGATFFDTEKANRKLKFPQFLPFD